MSSLPSVPISALPRELTLDDAVEGAHLAELDLLDRELRRGGAVLLEAPPAIFRALLRALSPRLAQPREGHGLEAVWVEPAPARERLGRMVLETGGAPADRARREALRLLREDDPRRVVVLPHVELLAPVLAGGGADGAPTRDAHELAALVAEAATGRLLALQAPSARLPSIVAAAFAHRAALGPVRRERLRHVVLQREARKLGVEVFEPDALGDACPGIDVATLRRALAGIADLHDFDPRLPETREAALDALRAAVRPAPEPREVVALPGPVEHEWRLITSGPMKSGVTRAEVDALAWAEVEVTWADGRVERVILGQRAGDEVSMRVPGRPAWSVAVTKIRALRPVPT